MRSLGRLCWRARRTALPTRRPYTSRHLPEQKSRLLFPYSETNGRLHSRQRRSSFPFFRSFRNRSCRRACSLMQRSEQYFLWLRLIGTDPWQMAHPRTRAAFRRSQVPGTPECHWRAYLKAHSRVQYLFASRLRDLLSKLAPHPRQARFMVDTLSLAPSSRCGRRGSTLGHFPGSSPLLD